MNQSVEKKHAVLEGTSVAALLIASQPAANRPLLSQQQRIDKLPAQQRGIEAQAH
ncbi:hypothetical protein [Pseudomonas citronellolis]|uniref:hypothetical protein n=1 Tax=Pseudomonas citronellolis TaxID=53408 RepID=UPI00135672D7|nr:hypothetical protein [Pseudomonas citronellolis]